MSEPGRLLITTEYRRFAEFCDACREYRYIGLCYSAPGVGKTLSARHFTDSDRFEAVPSPWLADDATLAAFATTEAVLYTPEIVNSSGRIQHDITRLGSTVRTLREEPERRRQHAALVAEKRAEDQRRFEELLVVDWMRPPPADPEPKPVPPPATRQPLLAPVGLVIVDGTDRLRVPSLEQLRDLFYRNPIGLVLIGMPGMEKRLARYPQLYSRIGFVHAFRPLRANEIRQLLATHCRELGLDLPADGVGDPDCVAAIIRMTAGNFRLIHRLLSQIERILRMNELSAVPPAVVDAARESMVIGTA